MREAFAEQHPDAVEPEEPLCYGMFEGFVEPRSLRGTTRSCGSSTYSTWAVARTAAVANGAKHLSERLQN